MYETVCKMLSINFRKWVYDSINTKNQLPRHFKPKNNYSAPLSIRRFTLNQPGYDIRYHHFCIDDRKLHEQWTIHHFGRQIPLWDCGWPFVISMGDFRTGAFSRQNVLLRSNLVIRWSNMRTVPSLRSRPDCSLIMKSVKSFNLH